MMLNGTGNVFLQTALFLANTKINNDYKTTTVPSTVPSFQRSPDEIVVNSLYSVRRGGAVADKCFGELGCYSINPPWTDTSRPVSQFPESPEKLSPKFCLFTRFNRDTCQYLNYSDPISIDTSFLVPFHRAYFVVHGFLERGERPWAKKLTAELLAKEDANVVVVDWGNGSSPPYAQAVANIRVVGTIMALLIHALNVQTGLSPEFCHIIGHSLGAHLAGYVGSTLKERFNMNLGRITGLDPAEPHFDKTDPIVRLDPTDAIYVDVVHTDAGQFIKGGLGMDEPIGHLDFYPNGGSDQPGCDQGLFNHFQKEQNGFLKGLRKFLGCDHVRSIEYFIESIKTKCDFLAVECDSYEDFLNGECFECNEENLCARLGFTSIHSIQKKNLNSGNIDAPSKRDMIKLYTITNSSSPFCQTMFRITVRISNSNESVVHGGEIGLFSIQLHGVDGITKDISLFNEKYFKPGSKHRQVVADMNIGRIKHAILKWEHRMTFNILTWRIEKPLLHVEDVIVETLEDPPQRLILCSGDSEKVFSSVPVKLYNCNSVVQLVD